MGVDGRGQSDHKNPKSGMRDANVGLKDCGQSVRAGMRLSSTWLESTYVGAHGMFRVDLMLHSTDNET
jgi:hypothetical protein